MNSNLKNLTKSGKDNNMKNVPKRIKLRPAAAVYSPEMGHRDNLKTIRMVSGLHGLVVIFVVTVQLIQIDHVMARKMHDFPSFACCYCIYIMLMTIPFIFTFVVTLKRFRTPGRIGAAMSFQYLVLVVWFVSSVHGAITAYSKGSEVSEYERFLVCFSFMLNLSSAMAAWYNSRLLSCVEGYEKNKIRALNAR